LPQTLRSDGWCASEIRQPRKTALARQGKARLRGRWRILLGSFEVSPSGFFFALDIARRSFGSQAATPSIQGFLATFGPSSLDRPPRVDVIMLIPVAKGVAVPRCLRQDCRQAQFVPDAARMLHVFTAGQCQRRHVVLERSVDEDRGIFTRTRFWPVPGRAIRPDMNIRARVRPVS